ncbi:hypothetical protein Ndes2526B_g04961 [Nannochloris sp. 'desiccata']
MLGHPAWSDLQKENVKDLSKEQARRGARNLATNFQPLDYHAVQIVWINPHYPQTTPVEVWATNLTSPKSSTSSSSSVNQKDENQMQKAFLSNSNSKVLIPATFENGYYIYSGVLLEKLPKCGLQFELFSPSEAIQESFFNPIAYPNPRFKLGQHSSGCQAWLFTSSHSKIYWFEQCREGIKYANSIMAASCPSFIPIDPNCPLVEKLILDTSFLGESIVLGAKRWYKLVSRDFDLQAEALGCNILKFNGRLLNSSSTRWRPLSFAASTAKLAILFLACVWEEASCSNNTCFDWETSACLLDWILKSNFRFKRVRKGEGFEINDVEWALAKARKV